MPQANEHKMKIVMQWFAPGDKDDDPSAEFTASYKRLEYGNTVEIEHAVVGSLLALGAKRVEEAK